MLNYLAFAVIIAPAPLMWIAVPIYFWRTGQWQDRSRRGSLLIITLVSPIFWILIGQMIFMVLTIVPCSLFALCGPSARFNDFDY